MKPVIYTDRDGWRRRVLVKDEDGEEMAEYGLPAGPPNVDDIDWEWMKRELNNYLVDHDILDYSTLMSKRGLEYVANLAKRTVADVFRRKATDAKQRETS